MRQLLCASASDWSLMDCVCCLPNLHNALLPQRGAVLLRQLLCQDWSLLKADPALKAFAIARRGLLPNTFQGMSGCVQNAAFHVADHAEMLGLLLSAETGYLTRCPAGTCAVYSVLMSGCTPSTSLWRTQYSFSRVVYPTQVKSFPIQTLVQYIQ